MKILLIEDNPQNAYLLGFLLEQDGFLVVHKPSGMEGIARAAQETFDMILLDIQLPGMDGYAVASHLRSQANSANLPIVAVTSHALAGDREKAIASGCSGYIEKPIDPDTFVGEIHQILGGKTRMNPP